MDQTISTRGLHKIIRGLITFPYPTICRHMAALELLDLIERETGDTDSELVDAIIQGGEGDTKAL